MIPWLEPPNHDSFRTSESVFATWWPQRRADQGCWSLVEYDGICDLEKINWELRASLSGMCFTHRGTGVTCSCFTCRWQFSENLLAAYFLWYTFPCEGGFSFSTKMNPQPAPSEVSNILVVLVFCCLGLLFVWLLLCGLPKKPLQDESVKNGCPRSWAIFMGLLVLCASWIFLGCLGGARAGWKEDSCVRIEICLGSWKPIEKDHEKTRDMWRLNACMTTVELQAELSVSKIK